MVDHAADLAVLVLAGGASSRFGSDKVRAMLAGQPVLERTLDAVAQLVELRSAAESRRIGSSLVIGPWAPEGWRARQEPLLRRGPAAAISFGMRQVDSEWVLVVGADHPLVAPALLSMLVERTVRGGIDAVVPVRDGHDEPLVACYRRSVGQVAQEQVAIGERSLRAVLERVRVDRVPEQDWRRSDPDGRSFLDVDTPNDLAMLHGLLDPPGGHLGGDVRGSSTGGGVGQAKDE